MNAIYYDKSVLDFFLTSDICLQLLNLLNWGRLKLKSELNDIGQNALYDLYDSKKFEVFESDSASLKSFEQLLQKSAPILLKTLKSLSEPDETGHETDYAARWVLIMSILNFSWRRNQYSNLSILLDLHLFFKDLRARELNLLDRLDVTVSYKTVHRVLK